MDEHDYVYLMKPLVIPGLVFLIVYPLVLGSVHFFRKLPILELRLLIGIYVLSGLGILALWFIAKSKRVRISDEHIVFSSVLGEHVLEPQNIRRVAFYFDHKGREIAQIRSNNTLFYVTEYYFPFPELMSDLEQFIRQYDIRSNLSKNAV